MLMEQLLSLIFFRENNENTEIRMPLSNRSRAGFWDFLDLLFRRSVEQSPNFLKCCFH